MATHEMTKNPELPASLRLFGVVDGYYAKWLDEIKANENIVAEMEYENTISIFHHLIQQNKFSVGFQYSEESDYFTYREHKIEAFNISGIGKTGGYSVIFRAEESVFPGKLNTKDPQDYRGVYAEVVITPEVPPFTISAEDVMYDSEHSIEVSGYLEAMNAKGLPIDYLSDEYCEELIEYLGKRILDIDETGSVNGNLWI